MWKEARTARKEREALQRGCVNAFGELIRYDEMQRQTAQRGCTKEGKQDKKNFSNPNELPKSVRMR